MSRVKLLFWVLVTRSLDLRVGTYRDLEFGRGMNGMG